MNGENNDGKGYNNDIYIYIYIYEGNNKQTRQWPTCSKKQLSK
jgi:hypothetical protein